MKAKAIFAIGLAWFCGTACVSQVETGQGGGPIAAAPGTGGNPGAGTNCTTFDCNGPGVTTGGTAGDYCDPQTPCTPSYFCAYAGGKCGTDGPGVCQAKPYECDSPQMPAIVCGCDGQNY